MTSVVTFMSHNQIQIVVVEVTAHVDHISNHTYLIYLQIRFRRRNGSNNVVHLYTHISNP